MKKGLKKAMIAAVALCGTAAAFTACSKKQAEIQIDPALKEYDFNYGSTMPSNADGFMKIDGELSETAYENRNWFENYLSEDLDGTSAHIAVTTVTGEKGWYVAAKVYDTAIKYNGLLAATKNSTVSLYYALSSDYGNDNAVRRVFMDAGRVYGAASSNISLLEYAVKTQGEIGGVTSGMTMELFIPWRAMGLEEKPENADLIMMPAYFMQKGGMYRNICPLPYYPSSSAAYYLFNETGYAHAEKEGALIGSAKNGHTKTGVWEEENVEKNEENGKITLSGTVRTEKSTYSKGYVKDLLAENFIFSATAKPLEGAYEATVGVSVGIPNGRRKLLSVRAENGSLSSKTRIAANYYADDYDGRNNVDAPLFRYTREKTLAEEGVRFTIVKEGAKIYGMADGNLIFAETISTASGKCFACLNARKIAAEFTDISYADYDGNAEGMNEALRELGLFRVSAESEGYGSISVDKAGALADGNVTFSVTPGAFWRFSALEVNGEDKTADYIENAASYGRTMRYTLNGIQDDVRVKAVFEEYEGVTLKGKLSVAGAPENINLADAEFYAYTTDKNVLFIDNVCTEEGDYTLELPVGEYEKILVRAGGYQNYFTAFADGSALIVPENGAENKNFTLKTRELTFNSYGSGASVWTYTGDNEYTVTGMNHGNAFTTANFGTAQDFMLSARIVSDGDVEAGIVLYGEHKGRRDYDVMLNIHTADMGIALYGWVPGWADGYFNTAYAQNKTYDNKDFLLTAARSGGALSVFINGELWKTYKGEISSALDFSKMGEMRVGLAVRGLKGATFSDCSFTTDKTEIDKLLFREAKLPAWDDSYGTLTVSGLENGMARLGDTVKITIACAEGKIVKVYANGSLISAGLKGDGVYEYYYTIGDDGVTFAYEAQNVYRVSGTLPAGLSGADLTVRNGDAEISYKNAGAVTGTEYSLSLADGTYDLVFTGKSLEGMIAGVTVNGAAVQANLEKAYQRVFTAKYGGGASGTNGDFIMTGNGKYAANPLADGDSYTLGVLGTAKNFVAGVRIKNASKKEAGIGIQLGAAAQNLLFIKTGDDKLVQLYSWTGGWYSAGAVDFSGADANDYEFTLVRYEGRIGAFVNGRYIAGWSGEITGSAGGGYNIDALGEGKIGLLLRGRGTGVTFEEYFFTPGDEAAKTYLVRTATVAEMNEADGELISVAGIGENGETYLGEKITLKLRPAAGKSMAVLVNNERISPVTSSDGVYTYTFAVKENTAVSFETKSVYKVSGTLPEELKNAAMYVIDENGESYFAENAVSGDTFEIYLSDGTYLLAFTGETREGVITTEVRGAAAENLRLEITYAKVTVATPGGKGTEAGTRGTWTKTANGEYTVEGLHDGNAFTIAQLGKSESFIVSAKIKGGKGNYVGAGVNIVGDDFGDDTANKNLQFFKINSDSFVQLYSWGPGSWQGGANGGAMIEKDGGTADDFVFTLIRYEKAFHVFINGHFVKTWENTVEDHGRTIDLTKIGTVVPGMLLRGNYGSTDVRFSEWEYTSDKTAVAEKLALGRIGGTVEGGNGTVTATLVENGVETNVKYSANITNKAYSLSLTAGKTYNLYFDCGSTDGILQGVTATKEGVTANLDKTYAKITVATPGGKGTVEGKRGTWTRTANNEYTVEGLHDGNAFTIAQFGKSESFIVSAKIKGGNGKMEAGFTLLTDDSVKVGDKKVENLQIFRRCDAARKFMMYSWSVSWMKSGLLNTSVAFDENDYTMTLIKYENKLRLYVNDSHVITFEGSIKGVDISSLGSVTVGMSLRGMYSKTVKFCDWSYSAAESDITEYISAHNS